MTVDSLPLYKYTDHRSDLINLITIFTNNNQIPRTHSAPFRSKSPELDRNIIGIQPITRKKMGVTINNSPPNMATQSHYHIHKIFLFCNYILLGAASSCIFLTLSLRLVPSLCGFFLILLQGFTIAGAISGCAAASSSAGKWYGTHMVATVLTAIFQGSVSVLIFSRTENFLGNLKSYVRQEDAEVILKLGGGLCILIFCLEWVVLTLAFVLKYYTSVENDSAKVVDHEDEMMKQLPWNFHV